MVFAEFYEITYFQTEINFICQTKIDIQFKKYTLSLILLNLAG